MKVRIINKSENDLPKYQTVASAGVDIRANNKETIVLESLERKIVPTGLFLEIPEGFEVQVRPRSGLAAKHGITLLNSPGTIDADYRGEIGVILVNLSKDVFEIKRGERIAQMVFCKHETFEFEQVEHLSDSERGAGGFGSTGKQ